MKKFLCTLLLLSPNITYAENTYKNLYLKVNLATNHVIFLKQYSRILPDLSAGIGYYFNDIYRIDLVAGHAQFSSDSKYIPHEETDGSLNSFGTKHISYKTQTQYLMLNNYVNIISRDSFQCYVSGGIGLNKIKEQATHLYSGVLVNGNIISVPLSTDHYISKSTKNFIYSLGVGTSTKIHSNANLDIAYNYKDFGKPKYNTKTMSHILSNKKYRTHNVSIGIRFDL